MENLTHAFKELRQYLDDDSVVEILVNCNGSLWIDRRGVGLEDVGDMTDMDVDYIVRQVASYNGLVINDEIPFIETTLPFNEERFSAVKRITKRPVFSIRKRAKLIPLETYLAEGIIDEVQYRQIIQYAKDGVNIGVIGATASGKSTLVNSILNVIAMECPKDRMIIVEDTVELRYASRNVLFFGTEVMFDLDFCLKRALRFTPSRMTVGELRDGRTAWGFLKMLNTGHNGGLFTLHADNCEDALEYRFPQLISEVITTNQNKMIANTIQVLISIQRNPLTSKRKVQEIIEVKGFDGNKFIFDRVS